jgi:hypothetical protein
MDQEKPPRLGRFFDGPSIQQVRRTSALDDVQDVPEPKYQDRDHQTHHEERDRLLAHHCLDVLNHVYSSLIVARAGA